jgi:hypothetical protein
VRAALQVDALSKQCGSFWSDVRGTATPVPSQARGHY